MKLIFISGPFRASNAWEIEHNIRQAEAIALELWRMGFAVICPHTNTRFFQGAAPDKIWLQGYLEMLRRCDAIYQMPNSSKSEGCKVELEFAKDHNTPIIDTLYAARLFLKKETDHLILRSILI